MQLYNAMAVSLEVGAGFKSADGTLRGSDAHDRVAKRNKRYLRRRRRALEQFPEARPFFLDAAANDEKAKLFSAVTFPGDWTLPLASVTRSGSFA